MLQLNMNFEYKLREKFYEVEAEKDLGVIIDKNLKSLRAEKWQKK